MLSTHRSVRKDRRIVPVQLKCPTDQPLGFQHILTRVSAPTPSLSLHVAASGLRECQGKIWIKSNGLMQKIEGLVVRIFLLPYRCKPRREDSSHMPEDPRSAFAENALSPLCSSCWRNCAHHARRHLVLQFEDVFQLAVEAFRPECAPFEASISWPVIRS